MSDWELVDILATKPVVRSESDVKVNRDGLAADVESLHNEFWRDAPHLTEVENRHIQVLVSAGMIPEEHIAATEPSRKLNWLIDELNGRIDPDGLSIPVKGLDIEDMTIHKMTKDDETIIKLNFIEKDGQELQRELTIDSNSEDFNFQANFYNNRLYLRW
ncbi:MAG TPA: hypothetical protein HA354_02240 [Candidatus Poseidoniaceae archaeon]|nr:MAG TPA: hypothetical protein D7I07_02225 [Candidatus Poseidoniales archaeon]HII37299.1 hypothetical protein [Candidatus Poseidoniaceae archaeon]|tara:strand:- start:118 stop:597 length:480 start_codon:yes stop_codon:yes gene_type:complete